MASEARFAVVASTGAFDFTPAFEDAVLRIAPSALFLIVAPRKVAKSRRPIVKVGLIGVYTALQLAVLLNWALTAKKGSFSQLRITLWLADHNSTNSGLFTSTVAVKLFVLICEAWEKRPILLSQYQFLSLELTSSILARSVFCLAARALLPKVRRSFGSSSQSNRHSLAFSTLWAMKYIFMAGVAPRLALAVFKYTLPFLITRTTSWTADLSQSDEIGWGLTGAWVLVFLGQAISNGFYYQITYRFVTSIRGSLCTLIYTKTLDLSSAALDESVAVSLMSTDTEIAIFLLYRQLGLAALAPVVVANIATTGTLQLTRFIGLANKRWVQGIQTRVDVTASVLASMKEVKMLGLSDIVSTMIQNLRVAELNLSRHYRRLLAIQTFIAMNTQTLAPLATFATFVIASKTTGQPLNTESAYTSLSLIYLLSDPMVVVFRTIPFVSAALACFSRIQNYLLSESCTDYRLPLSDRDHHPNPEDGNKDTLGAITGASFGWVHGKPDILKNITLNIRRSCFTFVVGPVGSGKSTLLRAMLGEVPPRAGRIHAYPGNIAFVGQEPWIQNLTIRDNILGSTSYDAEWYARVVYACGLQQDINELPDGDATRAGSAGLSLSGGQKQRLALARAVYSGEKTVLLDDVFAGQDAATEEHIFQSLFAAAGLFRRKRITVVCVTNTIHRLAYADHVVALDLQSDTDYLRRLAVEQNHARDISEPAEPSVQHRQETISRGQIKDNANQNDAESEMAGRVLGELATYAYYFGSVPIWHTIVFTALIILYAGGYRMTALVLRAAYIFLVVMVPMSSEVLHARLLHSVMNAPLAFFSRTDVGVTTNRFSQDMSVVNTELPFALVDFCVNFALILISVILMCVFSGDFAAALVPFVAFCWFLQKFYVRTSRQIRLFDLEAKSPLFTQFLDLIEGLTTVRAFKWGPRFIERYLDLLDASQRPFYLLFCIQRWLGLVLDLMTAVLLTVMMVLVVQLQEQLTAQYVALAFVQVMSFGQSLAHVIQDWTQLETSFGAVARIKTFCSDTESEDQPGEMGSVPERWPAHGHIAITDLVALYNAGGGGEPILRGVSLDIPAGAKVGICGRSGSGKSSLLGCILRPLELGPGSRITIDGIDITTLPRQAVRAAVAVQEQQQQIDDSKIMNVLCQLKMHDIVDRLGGLDSPLDADRLSQGQRQLFCVARAMLSGKRIILIDEASSNVDERSERLIRDAIREQFATCTVIAVAHRLGAIVDFDCVAVMGDGRLLEWDNPQALLKRNSEFKRLWDPGAS
ncbi:P-loop containing nucleoside triphosphate hydrolase protein [Aspergillus navahoensis]